MSCPYDEYGPKISTRGNRKGTGQFLQPQNTFLESYRTSPVTLQFYESFKKIVKFPEYFPAIKKFFVTDKIYVQTYLVDKDRSEFFVFNKDGKMEKRLLLPVLDNDFLSPAVYSIANGKTYYLKHNEKNDQWEVHILKLDV